MIFIRTLFGDYNNSIRRKKIDRDLEFCKKSKYPINFICLTYGKDNHAKLLEYGFKSILISDNSLIFPDSQFWAHKIKAWLTASESYSEFIYLDWDVQLTGPLPSYLDESLETKKLQASLRIYHNKKIPWRKVHPRKTPCASWIYFGNKEVVKKMWTIWEQLKKPRKEEQVLAYYTDGGKELDLDYYLDNFEPINNYFYLKNEAVFKRSPEITPLFHHFCN